MQIRFDFDTNDMEVDRLKEKMKELQNIEEIVKTSWENAAERSRKRAFKEGEGWIARSEHDSF
jgi:hypothetical protein